MRITGDVNRAGTYALQTDRNITTVVYIYIPICTVPGLILFNFPGNPPLFVLFFYRRHIDHVLQ